MSERTISVSWVERFYEDALLGGVGFDQVEVNAKGRVMKVVSQRLRGAMI